MKIITRIALMMTGSLLCLGSYSGSVMAADVGPNFAVSTENGDQTEPSIAVDPSNPNHLVAGVIDIPEDRCRFYSSFDGGNTWNTGLILDSVRGSCADPSLAFDSAGNVYFAGLFFNRQFSGGPKINTAICVAKSVDGGDSYAFPVCIQVHFQFSVDKPHIAIDTTGGPLDGTIYVAHNSVSNSDPFFRPMLMGTSIDGGVSFFLRTVHGIGNNTFAHAAVGPEGEVYVSWRQFSPSEIRIAKSTSGGMGLWFNKARVAEIGDQDSNANVQGVLRTTRYPITGVSPRGEVFVMFADDPPPFMPIDFPLVPQSIAPRTTPFGINNAGKIVGEFVDLDNAIFEFKGFLLNGGAKPIVVVDGFTTVAAGINDLNQIVGRFSDATGEHGFQLDGNGFSTTPGFLPAKTIDYPGAISTRANGNNNTGQIVGAYIGGGSTHGFLLDDGSFTSFDFPNSTYTEAHAINDSGQIVGCYLDKLPPPPTGSEFHAFLRDEDGIFTNIDFPGSGSTSRTCAFGINNAGKIVGRFGDSPTAFTEGFLRDENGISTPINVPGALNTQATDINDAEEIIGFSGDGTNSQGFLAYLTISQNIWFSRSAGNRCDVGDNVTRTCSTHADCPNGLCVEGGTDWSNPVRINDKSDGDQFDPWMYVSPAGRIHVSWLDRRNDPNNFLYETFYATSANGGLTFSPNQRIATAASDPRGADLNGFIGDYSALAGADDTVFPAWPDMRDGVGNQNIYGARAECGLVDNGDGTITDTCTGVMWLQDANYAQTSGFDADGAMPWSDAVQWAEDLVFVGFDDWRLPISMGFDFDANCQAGATLSIGVNCIGSEMVNLFFVRGVSSTAPGVFINITPRGTFYWSGTEFNQNRAWTSNFFFGEMGAGNKPSSLSSWAVRDIGLTDTRTGSPVTVNPHPDVSVTFQAVAEGGATTAVPSTANPGPTSFEFLGTFYDINTTANVTFPVTVCLEYENSDIPMGQSEMELQITHLVDVNMTPMNSSDDEWVNITDSGFPDTVNNIICGTDSSLSSWAPALVDMPPTIDMVSATPNILPPPNHKMVPVTLAVSVTDDFDAAPTCQIASVSSNESSNSKGDGNTAPDFQVTADLTLNLRSERSGKGSGRVYNIVVECTDSAGNSSTDTVDVAVAHDQRKRK